MSFLIHRRYGLDSWAYLGDAQRAAFSEHTRPGRRGLDGIVSERLMAPHGS